MKLCGAGRAEGAASSVRMISSEALLIFWSGSAQEGAELVVSSGFINAALWCAVSPRDGEGREWAGSDGSVTSDGVSWAEGSEG